MKRSAKGLPLPTPSEAAFEKLLGEFDALAEAPAPPESSAAPAEENFDAFIERLNAQSSKFLDRDPFAGIGDRDCFVTKVFGVSFEGRQDVAAGMVAGNVLQLQRQPGNPFDPNAIALSFGNLQVGFLRKEIAKHLAPLIDGGMQYRAIIEHVTGGGQKNVGINIRVERERAPVLDAFGIQIRAAASRSALRAALIGEAHPRAEQRAVLTRVDAGKNTLAVFGTGRGKSFCYQYAAAYRALESDERTLVLLPLRALANDQHGALKRRFDRFGVRIFRASGAIDADERSTLMAALESGEWDIVLATPEFLTFHRDRFRGRSAPRFVVVDEAHHVFSSKHRVAYAELSATIASLGGPQVLGLTATAGDEAFAHMVRELKIDAWVIDPTVRENLRMIDARTAKDKVGYLRRICEGEGKTIVYCNSRAEATKVAQALSKDVGHAVTFYHANMPPVERNRVEGYFRAGDLRIIVATSAFGEGIDLPDVRNVVLYHLNFNFTEFNQQAGRAGRDGAPAQIHLLFNEADRNLNEFIIERESPTVPLLREIYRSVRGLAREQTVRLSVTDIARTLELDRVNERTIAVALQIFEQEGLIETGIDDDGRFVRFHSVDGKVDLTKNERFAEGEADRESFARFADFALSADAPTLERIVNRPIYPGNIELQR